MSVFHTCGEQIIVNILHFILQQLLYAMSSTTRCHSLSDCSRDAQASIFGQVVAVEIQKGCLCMKKSCVKFQIINPLLMQSDGVNACNLTWKPCLFLARFTLIHKWLLLAQFWRQLSAGAWIQHFKPTTFRGKEEQWQFSKPFITFRWSDFLKLFCSWHGITTLTSLHHCKT